MGTDLVFGVVDDDCLNNVKLFDCFKDIGYKHVHWLPTTDYAYEMFESGLDLDLLIVSWEFEKQSKYLTAVNLCSALRLRGFNSPVVFIARHSSRGDVVDEELEILSSVAYKYGAVNVLFKPYERAEVKSKIWSVKTIIENRRKFLASQSKLSAPLLKSIG